MNANCNNVLINCIINFILIVFLLISMFQINYCCGCFQNADRFSKKDNELQWAACVSQSVQETRRVKDPGGVTPYNGLYGEAPSERGTFFRLQV